MRKRLQIVVAFAAGVAFVWTVPKLAPSVEPVELSDEEKATLAGWLVVVGVGIWSGLSFVMRLRLARPGMRTQRRLVAFAAGIAALGLTAPQLGTHDDDPYTLSDEEEAALRRVVSTHQITSTHHWWPKWADQGNWFESWRVMLPPGAIALLYERKPLGTLYCLKTSVERGSPADAYMAVAYAYATVGAASHDSSLVHHALIHAECLRFGDRDRLPTFRQQGIEDIDQLIRDVKMRRPGDRERR